MPHSRTQLDRFLKPTFAIKAKKSLQFLRLITLAIAQIFVHARRAHDFAWVHNALGIKSIFYSFKQTRDFCAKHLRNPLAARQPVAVLSRHRPAVFQSHIAHFIF